ncbi:LUD domain-containing protein [Thauera sp.]|uniref:LutC/YkgG family protein n=1 Tax=Thauera sp. TaxID=1905334 RepID=UPI002B821804|nr:LUD domain-containing protein [Thauera sp.]HRP23030.1 LUD domain-containing protein [Thauera sp.]
MSAREAILNAVRGALGPRTPDPAALRREADALLEELPAIRPGLLADDLVEAFIARLLTPKVAATAERIADAAELPAAVARYLEARALPAAIALQPAAVLQALDWSGFELHDRVAPDETLAVGFARWGIAETGSLVFHSDAETPILANFLPLHHLVMVRADKVLAYLDDYAAAIAGARLPRNVNIITGASGTTDIEGSLVLGAHGPRYLHVVIVGEAAAAG